MPSLNRNQRAPELPVRQFLAITVAVLVAPSFGCTASSSGLDAAIEEGRHEIYTACVNQRMKVAPFGSGLAVHQSCLEMARRKL